MPLSIAVRTAFCIAIRAANGVLLRLPLKPAEPAVAQQTVAPLLSVTVTIVLLNVAKMLYRNPRSCALGADWFGDADRVHRMVVPYSVNLFPSASWPNLT